MRMCVFDVKARVIVIGLGWGGEFKRENTK